MCVLNPRGLAQIVQMDCFKAKFNKRSLVLVPQRFKSS
jgi:hypothetical protein